MSVSRPRETGDLRFFVCWHPVLVKILSTPKGGEKGVEIAQTFGLAATRDQARTEARFDCEGLGLTCKKLR